jgi:pyruvate,water dikinase
VQAVYHSYSTGLAGLDEVLTGVRPGDNIVWQVDRIDEYVPFVHHFCVQAARSRQPLVYFRFAPHAALLPEGVEAEVHRLHPERGFEEFISEIFDVIERVGVGGCYVFDCLSELAVDWYSDRMLGNFFMLTCPYLYDYETATYFALLRNRHTPKATDAIHATAQVVIDAYCNQGQLYVHPLKVYKRHSESMYMLHCWQGDRFVPVTRSSTIATIVTSAPQPWLDVTIRDADDWTRAFREAAELVEAAQRGKREARRQKQVFRKLVSMAVTRDRRLAALAEKYLSLDDLVEVGKRMIGTGLIGGKSVGMLLARAILRRSSPRWAERLEPHDSFFIGSDVFYTYLIRNGSWWVRRQLREHKSALDRAQEARHRLLRGSFPADVRDQFMAMLNYFGQSPIIVRSSSLLEDAYGNSFSGKYESVFCANQGTRADRLEALMEAVRTVYASTMNREALAYRAHWGLLGQDEQMALLVQRVSGERYGSFFYPQVAGVAFSFNPFVWSSDIDPAAGFLRLVFGLGTRAVDRNDDDYTRIVALNAPQRLPVAGLEEARKYAQRNVDVLDLHANQHGSRRFDEVVRESPQLPVHMFASRDAAVQRRAAESRLREASPWVLQFEQLLGSTDFVRDFREIVSLLQTAYAHPVDIEFTANFLDETDYRINILQCRPFQVRGKVRSVKLPRSIPPERTVLRTRGPVIGHSRVITVDRLIYVVPEVYAALSLHDRYAVARLIGRLTHPEGDAAGETVMLVGPGRWGTTTPALGVPVTLAEIDTVSVLCEVAEMHEGLVPEVSLGTHFFNDLVELDMLYLAVYPGRVGSSINRELLANTPNRLGDLEPGAEAFGTVLRVIDAASDEHWGRCCLHVDAMAQRGVCYLASAPGSRASGRARA